MKHVTYFIILLLLTACVSTLGFAGKTPSGTITLPTLTQQGSKGSLTDTDIPSGIAKKSSSQRVINAASMATSKLTPRTEQPPVRSMLAGLSGTYHIPGDFSTIGNAVAVLNFVGLTGDATFQLDNASYTEFYPVVFSSAYAGAGTYKLTVMSAINSTVNFVSTLTEGKGFAFNGAKNVTLDGLTVQYGAGVFPTGDAFAATIYITNVSQDITIKNTSVKGQINNAVWADQTDGRPAIFVWSPDADGDGSKNLTFDGCTITNATYGMKVLGDNWSIDNFADGLNITNCRIGGAYGEKVNIGFFVEATKNVNFTGNIIDGVELMQTYWYNGPTEWDFDGGVFYAGGTKSFMFDFGQSTGAHFLIVDGGVFVNNIYRNIGYSGVSGDGVLTYGTRVYSYNFGLAKTAYFENNRIYNITNPGGAGAQINGLRGPAGYVYHNSISLSGAADGLITINGINGHTQCYNNAVSLNYTGSTTSLVRGIVSGSNIDYNAIYSTGAFVSGYTKPNAAALAGYNKNGTFGPLNFDADLHITTGPSAAEDIGKSRTLPLTDIDGDARDTTTIGKRDAGADEFPTLASPWVNDVMPLGLAYPGASTPTGISVSPQVIVKNNTPASVGSFSVTVTIVDALTSTVEFTATETVTGLNAMEVKTIPLAGSWAVTVVGTKNITVTTSLVGDVQPGNDVATASTLVSAPTPVPTTKTYTFDASAEGWAATTGPSATTDWKRSSSFTKLGGPYAGSSWVTERPLPTGAASQATYTEGGYASSQGYTATYPGANLLTSPWLDISGMSGTDVYVAFNHSMRVEPDWDCAWMQYTVDGLNWKNLGTLNDPNGINWYNTGLYKLAHANPDAFDDATAVRYGLIPDADHLPNRWATNDAGLLAGGTASGVEAGPDGWVYVQLHITPITYPDIVHAAAIKFRYIGFSDASTASSPGGWAFDNFFVGNAAPTLTPASLKGKVFADANGDGIVDPGDLGQNLVKVYSYYFGVLNDSASSDVNGDYAIVASLPGLYTLKCAATGHAFSVPFGTNSATVNYPGNGIDITQDFGLFDGSVSGTMFSDVNDNGAKDPGEPGLSGWKIEVRKDSATGTLVASALTSSTGAYSIMVPPASYVVKRIAQPTVGRQKLPAVPGTYEVTISLGTPNIADLDFGDFIYAIFTTEAVIDQNGNGTKDAGDIFGLAAGNAKTYYNIYLGGTFYAQDTLMDGVKYKSHISLDLGTYGWKRVSPFPTGWMETTPDTFTVVVDAGGMTPTISFMYFKFTSVAGNKWNDLNGNGAKDVGEPGLAGVTINLSGVGAGYPMSTVTDVNGDFIFNDVGPLSHTVSEVLPAGWTRTFPGVPGTYTFNALSGHNPINWIVDQNFANFKNIVVTGMLFRDRNNDGVQGAGEEGLSGWDVVLTPGSTVQTDVNGEFSFNVGPNPAGLTLNLTVQSGWTRTFPASVPYAIVAVSGADVTGKIFGVFKGADATTYRTFTYAQLSTNDQGKPGKAPKIGKSVAYPPNTANLIAQMIIEGAAFQVGLNAQLGPDGKELAYLKPVKQTDVFASFNVKGAFHTLPAKPFAFTKAGKLMQKLWKKMGPDKKDDLLLAELLTLQVNLLASTKGHTDAAGNFGALLYTDAGPWGSGPISIDGIADYADNVMTNWIGVDGSVYPALYTAVKKINEAFANTVINDTTVSGGWLSAKYKWMTYKTVYEVSFLKAAVAPAKQRKDYTVEIPVQYTLGQNYPNPFNPTTNISFDIPTSSIVTLKIFNILGQEVATVLNREEFSAGQQDVEFDASTLASGVYLYQIVAEQLTNEGNVGQTFTQVKKMVLMK